MADAVIVGSGAGGGACAWALSRLGLEVLVLEAGPHYNPYEDYRQIQPDWEIGLFPDKNPKPLRYSYAPFQPLDDTHNDLRSWNKVFGLYNQTAHRAPNSYSHVQGVGGSTLHFSGEAHRLHPQAFRLFSDLGVAADWPMDYAALEPYYQQAEYLIGVSGVRNEGHRPRSRDLPLPAHAISYASQQVEKTAKVLGLEWEPNTLAVLSRPYDGRPGCNYCNSCSRGCPRKDKGSVDVTFLAHALRTERCTIRANTHVLRLLKGDKDRVLGVECADQNGNLEKITAPIVVIACGAIETPRLLMLSDTENGGLGNESGQLGKNFMETLSWDSSGLHPQDLGSYRGLPSDMITWTFNAPDAIPGVIGGCRFDVGVGEANLIGPINYARRVVPGWGKAHKQEMRRQFGRVLTVGAIGESLPNDRSFISLDPSKKDHFGRPVAKIASFLPDIEIKRLSFMAQKCREILYASGVEELIEEYGTYDFFSSTHVFGTARMGQNPETSVVNPYGQSHRWKNLFVADASVFPSSGGGEAPSLTIEALAIRTAEHIHNQSR